MKRYLKKGIAFLITLVFLLQALIASPLSSVTAFADDEAADEQVLEAGLEGYAEYKKRVKYKVIPLIW